MRDFFILAFNNLRRRKLRSWLTIIGIFIGIAAVVALISLGQGLQDFINEQFEQVGGDKILIQGKTLGPPGSATSEELMLTKEDLEVIKNINGVEDAAGAITRYDLVRFREESELIMINGLTEEYLDIFGDIDALEIVDGRQIRNEDRTKIVVGYNHVYGNLWDKNARVGNRLELKGREFEIVGVLKKQGNPYDDGSIWMAKDTMQELFGTGDDEGIIVVKTKAGFNPEKVAEETKRKLRDFRDEREGEETFSVETFSGLAETFSDIFGAVQAVFIGIAAISLIVGGIGIMNTMYTSVLERTKEIGTMKAIGAKNSDILLIFLIESGLLGLVGGIIGVIIGIGLAKGAEYIAFMALGTEFLKASLSVSIIGGALLFGFVIGSISGVLPAYQASRLKPVDALRYE